MTVAVPTSRAFRKRMQLTQIVEEKIYFDGIVTGTHFEVQARLFTPYCALSDERLLSLHRAFGREFTRSNLLLLLLRERSQQCVYGARDHVLDWTVRWHAGQSMHSDL